MAHTLVHAEQFHHRLRRTVLEGLFPWSDVPLRGLPRRWCISGAWSGKIRADLRGHAQDRTGNSRSVHPKPPVPSIRVILRAVYG